MVSPWWSTLYFCHLIFWGKSLLIFGESQILRQMHKILLISAPSLGVYYFFVVDSVYLSICLPVCHKHCFFFVSWPSVLHDKNYKTLFFDFWFRPQRPKFTPQNFHKFVYKLACMADRQTGDVWAYQGVFGDGRFNGTMQNVVGSPLLPWQRNLG